MGGQWAGENAFYPAVMYPVLLELPLGVGECSKSARVLKIKTVAPEQWLGKMHVSRPP